MYDILTIWTDDDALVTAISLHFDVKKKVEEEKLGNQSLCNYLKLLVRKLRYERRGKFVNEYQYIADQTPIMTDADEERLTQISTNISDSCRAVIDKIATSIIDNVVELLTKQKKGVDNFTDARLRLDHIVFSILGMNDAGYGGSEVAIFFDQSAMMHPDAYFTLTAATGYNGNSDLWYRAGWDIYDRTEWSSARAPKPPTEKDREEGMKNFMKERLSFCTPGWEYLLAKEWICRCNYHSKAYIQDCQKIADGEVAMNDVTPDIVWKCMSMYKDMQSHGMTEVHLPSKTPIDAIEDIVIIESVLNGIKSDPGMADFLSHFKNITTARNGE